MSSVRELSAIKAVKSRVARLPGVLALYHVFRPTPEARISRVIADAQAVAARYGLHELRIGPEGGFFRNPYGAEFVYVPNWGAYGAEYGTIHERAEIEFCAERVPKRGLVYDVGANLGTFCINLAILRPDLTIHAFEPVSSTFSWLNANIRRNQLEARVLAHRCALLDRNIEVAVTTRNYTDNRLAVNVTSAVETAPGRRLDDLARETGMPGFVKVDVEGAEALVLRGGAEVLRQSLPVLLLEVCEEHLAVFDSSVTELEAMLCRAGYGRLHVADLHPVNRVYIAGGPADG